MSSVQHAKPPIVLVPGALTGGWIWEDNFARAFSEAGYQVHTPSFCGHGAHWLRRNRQGFKDYLADCEQALVDANKGLPPYVVGHSLGGLMALHAAMRVPVTGMVLLSPASHLGMRRSLQRLAARSPLSVAKFGAVACNARLSRLAEPPLGIYSTSCCPERSQAITAQLKSESLRVLSRLLVPPRLDDKRLNTAKILFVGAEGDHIIPPAEVRRAAAAIGSPAHIYPGLSHTYQAELSWPAIAADVLRWFEVGTKPRVASAD